MTCRGRVTYRGRPIAGATVQIIDRGGNVVASAVTEREGQYTLEDVPAGSHHLRFRHFVDRDDTPLEVLEGQDCYRDMEVAIPAVFTFRTECDCEFKPVAALTAGKRAEISVDVQKGLDFDVLEWIFDPDVPFVRSGKKTIETMAPANAVELRVEAVIRDAKGAIAYVPGGVPVWPSAPQVVQGEVGLRTDGPIPVQGEVGIRTDRPLAVRLQRTDVTETPDQVLWAAIHNRTRALSFERYQDYMNRALRFEENRFEAPEELPADARGRVQRDLDELGIHMHGVHTYQVLKRLTELFLLLECGVRIQRPDARFEGDMERRLGRHFTIEELQDRLDRYLSGDPGVLPYIKRVVKTSFPHVLHEGADGRLIGAARINEPCFIELIWCYWMEEGMLVQTTNAIARRFQNLRSAGERDPLSNLEIDPLRPLNNLLWGYIQDEYNRLSVRRRAFEYDHQYGLTLYGRATAGMQPADSRSKFLAAFHNLLHEAYIFFKEDYQTTVIADGFPLLNSIREVHLILAQGAGNQFGDLAWTARTEMMLMQYMLARPEIRAFLQGRIMVPYREPWESQVDTMKTLQGWTDATAGYFRDLAVFGEQILLSIRYGDWIADYDEHSAVNWARAFKSDIQAYMHAYRAVTGIDLATLTSTETVDATMPGLLLQKRTPPMHRTR